MIDGWIMRERQASRSRYCNIGYVQWKVDQDIVDTKKKPEEG